MIKIIAIIIAVLIVVITATNTSISTASRARVTGLGLYFIVWVEVILAQPQLLSKKSTLTTKLFLEPVVIFRNL